MRKGLGGRRPGINAMAARDTPEYLAVKKHLVVLKDAVLRGQIPTVLFQEDVISEDAYCKATNNALGRDERGNNTLKEVLQSLCLDPVGVFVKLCDALAEDKCTKNIADKMRVTHVELNNSSEAHDTEEFEKLRRQLEAFNLTLNSASDSKIELATIECFKHAIRQYIENGLRANIETCQVKNDIEKLCRVYLVIPTALWSWSMQEVEKAAEKLASERSYIPKPLVKNDTPPPSLFSKDTLYHACLCCEAISSSTNNSLSFFQSKRPQHSLTEVSFSQSRDGTVTPYLIAKQRDVIYVAFRSNLHVSEWNKSASSFEEGVRQQSSQIPLRFFMDELINNKKIVFTGFSFGGMLACCVSARLWHSTIDRERLLQRVICITFGQPFLQIKMVEEEIRICPQFMESIHSVFSKKDIVPLLFSFLNVEEGKHPNVSPGFYRKTKALVGPDDAIPKPTFAPKVGGLFHMPFVKTFLHNLAVLQSYHPQSRVTQKMKSATKELSDALRRIVTCQDAVTLYGNCYVMSYGNREEGVSWQQQAKQLAAIELNQHPQFVADQLDETFFEEHTAYSYMVKISRSYLEKQEKYKLPNQRQAHNMVTEVDALKPKVSGIQIHEYPSESVIVVQGENLWFSYKVCLDEKGPNQREFIAMAENTTQFMIEFRSEKCVDIDGSKQVKIALFTHFASPIRQSINALQEPHKFSPRQMQMAKYTPSQVIKLAYVCALLEQKHQSGQSKRFKAIASFLNQAVKVVPLESVFRAIAYQKYEIALECAEALKKRRLNLHTSQLMITGALKAFIRAHSGYEGELIDQIFIPPVLPVHQMLLAAKMWLQGQGSQIPSQQLPVQAIPLPFRVFRSSIQPQKMPPTQTPPVPSDQGMGNSSMPQKKKQPVKYSAVVAKKSKEDHTQKQESSEMQATQIMAVPFPYPVFFNPHLHPPPVPFPSHIMKFLAECLRGLMEQSETHQCFEFGKDLCIITKANISEVYSVSPPKKPGKSTAHLRSPLQVLSDGLKKIANYTEIMETDQALQGTKLPNEQMLKLLDEIFKEDVAVCAALLGAFMEQQIRIPLIYTAKTTAETLSSNTAPVAVGVWALFSQNCDTLKAKLESNNQSKLIVEIREYIEGISQQLPHNEDRMYAGKLQFLLQGIQEIVTASNQYISYSLEHQLCRNLKFEKSISLGTLIDQWDDIFENDALSLIGRSHRPLVARWLKWTILVHDLREALAQYTSIGVTGLVNSGKSLLVKKLFKIESVKVGTRAVKRTTVPLLYNLEDSVDGLDVIDFPGVDDGDHTVPELADLLLSIAQIVVFVVDFRRCFTDPVKAWLKALTKNGVALHICLTHADLLYSECKAEGKLDSIAGELKRIQDHFNLDSHRTRDVNFYSFNHPSDVSTEELKEFGINSVVDVGDWLVRVLRQRFKQDSLAEKLKVFLDI